MTDSRYLRNFDAITEEEQTLLSHSRVFIAGSGGLGGHLFSDLLRLGVGHITIIDGDVFEISNLNRQLLSSQDTLGVSKAAAAAAYAASVNPTVEVSAGHIFLTEENCAGLISGHDLVLDALDNIESRYILSKKCDDLKIPYVYGAICGWSAQIGFFPAGTAFQRIQMLYPQEMKLKDKSCLSFIPAVCASHQAAEAVKYLLRRKPSLQDSVLYLDLLEQETERIPF